MPTSECAKVLGTLPMPMLLQTGVPNIIEIIF